MDVTNFSSSSPHRMPTVSAAQALQDFQSPTRKGIATGLKGLDAALHNLDIHVEDESRILDGVARGKVTEVYGPPGVGKTSLGIQVAVNTLLAGQNVVWVDAASPLPGMRLSQVMTESHSLYNQDGSCTSPKSIQVTDILTNLHHYATPTLPHLIALLGNPSPRFPPLGTSLIIIDSLSTLIAAAYPRTIDADSTSKKPGIAAKHDARHWATTRKWAVLQYIISALQKLATVRNIAVVVMTQTVTKMQPGAGAMLIPAIASTAWDAGIASRIVLFRDWGWDGRQVRFAGVMKADGVAVGGRGEVGRVVAFTVGKHGLEEVHLPDASELPDPRVVMTPSRKRKRDEIRDSEDEDDLEGSDEDYGWAEDDDSELPEPPPQWQGSEDILIPNAEDGDEEPELDEEEDGSEIEDEIHDGRPAAT